MDNTMFERIFSKGNKEEKKVQKIRTNERQKEEQFVRERDRFAAAMGDEALSIHQNPELNDLTRWQQDLSPDIAELIHDLRNEVLIEGKWERQTIIIGYNKKNEPVVDYLPPLMNELGIRAIIDLAKPLVSRNLMMSNYSEERILMKLKRAVSTLIINLGYNFKIYGLDKKNLDLIVQMFRDVVEPTHFRSLNNGERNFLNTTTKRMETHTQEQQKEERKNWGFFN